MLDPSAPLPPSGIAGFADVDATADPAAYVAFLDGFQRGLAPMIEAGIDLLRLESGASVLDVGCGHGAVFERLAARIGDAGRITGLDSSRTLLEEARRRCDHRSLGVELHEGDAHQLPFNDAVFDATRADRVLIFLHNPRVALVEMARVTKPGGRIVVTEADLGSAIVDAPDPELTRTLLATAAEAVPGAWIGRRLRGLFVDVGLVDVEVRMFGAPSTSFGEWVRRMGLAPAGQRAAELGRAPAAATNAWLSDLEARDRAGRFFAASTFFMASAMRPAT